jgi:hypothetical protein
MDKLDNNLKIRLLRNGYSIEIKKIFFNGTVSTDDNFLKIHPVHNVD